MFFAYWAEKYRNMHHLRQIPDINYYVEVINPVPSWAMYDCEFLITHQEGSKRDIMTNVPQ